MSVGPARRGVRRLRERGGCGEAEYQERADSHAYLIGSFCPLARIMWVVCSDPPALLPSFAAAAASTVTLSPIFTVSRFQPPRTSAYGGPISILKCLTAPLSSFVSM